VKLLNYVKVTNLEQAYELVQQENNQIIGGGGWLKLSDVTKETGVDLELLGLDQIWENEEGIHIGAMCNLRELETNPLIQNYVSGIVAKSAAMIMGVTLRNIVTIGGTVCGKYGFSDLLTVLLAVKAKLHFYKAQQLSLEDFLQSKGKFRDVLVEIILPKCQSIGTFEAYKKTSLDFSLVNVAIVVDQDLRIAIGSRPGAAQLVCIKGDTKEYKTLLQGSVSGQNAELNESIETIIKAFAFGSNQRASKEYRIELAKSYILHGLREVSK
jgi:CO/xanthine dehydrogenase FAD-binding subunit